MGQNSTEVAYGFGQLGSSFVDTAGEHQPPTGKVIVAITFLEDTTLAGLVADVSQLDSTPVAGNTGYFSHTTAVAAVHGSGSDETDSGTLFPAGLTVYGRWKSVTLSGASATGGIICYFGI